MTECKNCPHPKAGHDKAGRCRLGGCPCPGFDDGQAKPTRPGFRRIAIDIPDGYVVSISLIPHDPTAPIIEVPAEAEETS